MDDTDRVTGVVGGRYHVERELGRGGMGIVYLATDTQLGRRVAIKLLPPDIDADHAERFVREVRLLSSLQHPNIVPLLDAGTTEGTTWYSMPYVEGQSLRERLVSGPLAPHTTLQIVRDVASALDAAHAKGVVHRDVKPANILLSSDRALLADFGVARALSPVSGGARTITQTGTVVGSPDYMAPEQIAATSVDARADQFALACVAYEMLSGRLPFEDAHPGSPERASPAVLVRRLSGSPARLPASLALGDADAVFRKALSAEPDARYPTCVDLASALSAAIASPPRNSARLRKRGRLATVVAAAAAALVAAAFLATRGEKLTAPIRLLVLPIQNGASDSLVWLADGLTDQLTSHLNRIPNLNIIARTSAARLANDQRPLSVIAGEVNVRHILSARLFADADPKRVRVTAALVRAADATELWSETVPIDLSDLQAGETALSRTVADGLRPVLGVTAIPADFARTNPQVYELLLSAGDPSLSVSWNDDRRRRADSLLQRAIAIDSRATEAYARLSAVRWPWLWRPRSTNGFEAMLDSVSWPARKAFALDSTSVAANLAMAQVHFADGKLDESRRRAEQALRLRSEDATALDLLGSVALCARQYEAARAYFRRALTADPLNPDHAVSLALTEVNGFGRLSEGRELIASTLPLWEDELARAFHRRGVIAMKLLGGGSVDSARTAAAEERARHPMEWSTASAVGPPELEWFLTTTDDWERVEREAQALGSTPLFAMRRAVAENRISDARRLAPAVRAAVANRDAFTGLGLADRGLSAAFAHAVEGDTTRALALLRELEPRGCGRPPVFNLEPSWVTYPAMVRALNGDTAGARRTLEAAFQTRPWPTREALRYHPILGPVLGYPRPPR